MTLVRLVPLLCCVLLPFRGLAQAETPTPPEGRVTAPPLISAPRGEIIPPGERLTSNDPGSPAIRIPVGLLVGTVGAAVGAIPGAAIVALTFCTECNPNTEAQVFGLAVAGVGMILSGAWAIDRVGDWLGGQGEYWPTVVGVVLGMLGSVGALFAVDAGAGAAGIVPAIIAPALGGAIAYEISNALVRHEATAASASRPRLSPLVAVSPRGGFIGGLAGSF
ncbi:MAG TPA: hypothetical protein VF815_13320 [Myxococcaceae bacterium]|jgi:hypothetical protein